MLCTNDINTSNTIRTQTEYCAPVWHYALTKAQSESLEAVQKRAIHITHNITRGMPYSSMLLHVNLDSLATRREDLSRRFFRDYRKNLTV